MVLLLEAALTALIDLDMGRLERLIVAQTTGRQKHKELFSKSKMEILNILIWQVALHFRFLQ